MITYKNGNYRVVLKEDGTKIHLLPDTEMEYKPDRVETLDICISTYCENNCAFCYENCSKDGDFADLDSKEVIDFVNTIPYGTEIALNFNSFSWKFVSMVERFLILCKIRSLIPNVTIRQNDFMSATYNFMLEKWKRDELIYGIGISLIEPNNEFLAEIKKVKWNNDIVIHTIAGVTPVSDYLKLKDCKVLILGYKSTGRGATYDVDLSRTELLFEHLKDISDIVDVLSFDNLALEQLSVESIIPEDAYKHGYMGNEGTISMFVDLVNMTYAQSSLVPKPLRKSMLKTIDEMYNDVKGE